MAQEKEKEWEKEREILKEEQAAQVALREKGRQLRKVVEDEKWKMEERFKRNMERLKEEKEALQQERRTTPQNGENGDQALERVTPTTKNIGTIGYGHKPTSG